MKIDTSHRTTYLSYEIHFVEMDKGRESSNNPLALAERKGQGRESRNNHLAFAERAREGKWQRPPDPSEEMRKILDKKDSDFIII